MLSILDPVVSEDQVYLDPVVWKDQLYLNPVVVKGSPVPESCCCERITCTWILLLWKDQLYLDPIVWKVQYHEMMQWLEGPGSNALYPWSFLLWWKDQLYVYLNPVVVKGSPVPVSCCSEIISSTGILLCERSSILRWCSDWNAPGPMHSILDPVVARGSAVPESCCCERISCLPGSCCFERTSWTWILLLWKDQLYLDPVVWKVQYLEMMQ